MLVLILFYMCVVTVKGTQVTGCGRPQSRRRGKKVLPSPGEVIRDHGASDGHLLEGKDELSDPDEAHSMVPHQVLQRPLHLVFNGARDVVLHWCPCQQNANGRVRGSCDCSAEGAHAFVCPKLRFHFFLGGQYFK